MRPSGVVVLDADRLTDRLMDACFDHRIPADGTNSLCKLGPFSFQPGELFIQRAVGLDVFNAAQALGGVKLDEAPPLVFDARHMRGHSRETRRNSALALLEALRFLDALKLLVRIEHGLADEIEDDAFEQVRRDLGIVAALDTPQRVTVLAKAPGAFVRRPVEDLARPRKILSSVSR